MIEISTAQTQGLFPIQEEELTLPNRLATIRALRVTENLENNEVFGPSCLALIRLHGSTIPQCLTCLAQQLRGPSSEFQCRQISGISAATFPSAVSRPFFRYVAHSFSSTRVLSFEAISNRLNAKIKARTLTWGGAAGPVIPHLRQVIIGVLMFRPARMHRSISSSSSRRLRRGRHRPCPRANPTVTGRPFQETTFSVRRPKASFGLSLLVRIVDYCRCHFITGASRPSTRARES